MEAADFYTGLVAELYEPLRGSVPEAAEYLGLIRRFGEPALELGCGGGDPLVELRAAGLDVEGVDSSADILRVCPAKAHRAGVDVVVHHQRMEELDLDRSYRLIFLAGSCPLDESGATVAVGDYAGQAAACIETMKCALTASGATIQDVISTRVLVASSSQSDLVTAWEVVRDAFGEHDVPSTLMGVTVLGYDDQLVEIEAVAAVID